ncbi:hypothetical protein Tco_0700213 [Tanacetum coccineum]
MDSRKRTMILKISEAKTKEYENEHQESRQRASKIKDQGQDEKVLPDLGQDEKVIPDSDHPETNKRERAIEGQ